MAKDAHDREDLLRDATALPERIELVVLTDKEVGNTLEPFEQPVFCGFREGDAFSFYWGQDTVFQFNVAGELRRAYWQERMVATYQRQLHWLSPDSSSGRLRLARTAFSEQESERFLAMAAQYVAAVEEALAKETATVVGCFPVDADVAGKVLRCLQEIDVTDLAVHPGVGRKSKNKGN